jgi:integrative and conjugative element protein (TIGR02256 family)
MLHASILADQIRLTNYSTNAAIKIWEQVDETGKVRNYSIDVLPEKVFDLGDYTVYCDEGLENVMRTIRAEHLPNEAGGILVGYYDLNLGTVVIVDALPPPSDSEATPHSFERGIEGLEAAISEISKRTAGVVGYIGEWHSHPDNYPAKPSSDDLFQLSYLAQGMAEDGLPAIQVIVNDTDITILQGEVR